MNISNETWNQGHCVMGSLLIQGNLELTSVPYLQQCCAFCVSCPVSVRISRDLWLFWVSYLLVSLPVTIWKVHLLVTVLATILKSLSASSAADDIAEIFVCLFRFQWHFNKVCLLITVSGQILFNLSACLGTSENSNRFVSYFSYKG
jgi:hypothetical protein